MAKNDFLPVKPKFSNFYSSRTKNITENIYIKLQLRFSCSSIAKIDKLIVYGFSSVTTNKDKLELDSNYVYLAMVGRDSILCKKDNKIIQILLLTNKDYLFCTEFLLGLKLNIEFTGYVY